jgi:hypothetical protein
MLVHFAHICIILHEQCIYTINKVCDILKMLTFLLAGRFIGPLVFSNAYFLLVCVLCLFGVY